MLIYLRNGDWRSLIFSTREVKTPRLVTLPLQIDGQSLQFVNEKKVLGVIMKNDLKWDRNVELMTRKANMNMRYLHSGKKFFNDTKILKQIGCGLAQ